MPELTLEERTLELDWQKAQLDADLRRAELAEKRAQRESEHILKDKELANAAGTRFRFTAAQATVAGAVLTVIGALGGAGIQAWNARNTEAGKNDALIKVEQTKVDGTIALEEKKQIAAERQARQNFEIGLILKAIAAPSEDERVRSLQFFVEAGFVEDKDQKIAALAKKPQAIPYLPAPKPPSNLSGVPASLVDILRRSEGEDPDAEAIARVTAAVKALVKVPLNENQISALVSLTYNIGIGSLTRSALLKDINSGDLDKVPADFEVWSGIGTSVSPALLKRRREEAALFNTPPASPASPAAAPAGK